MGRSDKSSPGWALVTGASSGIGESLAKMLAERGFNLVLVARDVGKLKELAAEYSAEYGVDVRPTPCDLSQTDGVRPLQDLLREIPFVSVLVNNAGFGVHGPFAEADLDAGLRLANLQIQTSLMLTKLVLPGMMRERSGWILNVASVYSFAAVPNQAVYSACKAFLLSFSRALAVELAGSGVSVTVLCPGVTQTQFRLRAGMREKKSFLSMTPAATAEAGLKGLFRGKSVVVPGFWNKIYVSTTKLIPGAFFARIAKMINSLRGVEVQP